MEISENSIEAKQNDNVTKIIRLQKAQFPAYVNVSSMQHKKRLDKESSHIINICIRFGFHHLRSLNAPRREFSESSSTNNYT